MILIKRKEIRCLYIYKHHIEKMTFYKNILYILEEHAKKNPDKIIFEDTVQRITYGQFVRKCRIIGRELHKILHEVNVPVAVYAEKSVDCLIMMIGILYSGNFYCVLDVNSPIERIEHIFDILRPAYMITNENIAENNFLNVPVLHYENIPFQDYFMEAKEKDLPCYRLIDTDPIYTLFTSGSTGLPKGAVISHKSVLAYANSVIQAFSITDNCIMGNQTPFYFSMSVLDIFVTIIANATMYIIPKKLFSFPGKLIELLNEKKINTLYWVPTAMNIVIHFRAFDSIMPKYLKLVMFAGETMPVKCVSYWQKRLPHVTFANLFGPTEITDTCTYHILNRIYDMEESVPIGIPFNNCDVFVVDERGKLISRNDTESDGELYVRGSFVGYGYYNAQDITRKAFVQNPLNSNYPEIVYKTGDHVKYNKNGELLYLGRMDHQIKHMGYRIELGEIEKVCYTIDLINACACVYLQEKSEIILFVQTRLTEADIRKILDKKLPKYMKPQQIIKKTALPLNANGKIDKIELEKEIRNNAGKDY